MPDETAPVETHDMTAIIADLQTQITGLANSFTELSSRTATADEIRNAVEPLSDQIATMSATIANLPASAQAELSDDDVRRNKWVDGVLNKWFAGDRPADEPTA